MKTVRRTSAFTLIELLTVIVIMIILAALLFPAIKLALTKGEISKAQSAVQNLSGALRAYYTEYGKWPITDTANQTYIADQYLVGLLKGSNVLTTANPTGTYLGNPRGIVFMEFKQADLDASSNFIDPWKKPYRFRLDVTYINQVMDPFTQGGTVVPLSTGVLVWSDGPDGQEDSNCGDPPGPYLSPPSCVNQDNVKSW
jgi:type II secretory pathway pseudopilin PulG